MSDTLNFKDDFYKEFKEIVSGNFKLSGRRVNSNYPPVDILEENDCFRLKADLPGLDRSDFEIILEENVLTICGDKKESLINSKQQYFHLERNYGSFHRSFNLPPQLNPDSAEAFYKDGILEIVIRKKLHSPVNAILIESD